MSNFLARTFQLAGKQFCKDAKRAEDKSCGLSGKRDQDLYAASGLLVVAACLETAINDVFISAAHQHLSGVSEFTQGRLAEFRI